MHGPYSLSFGLSAHPAAASAASAAVFAVAVAAAVETEPELEFDTWTTAFDSEGWTSND